MGRVYGQIVAQETGTGIPRLRVVVLERQRQVSPRALDNRRERARTLGVAVTSAKGEFVIDLGGDVFTLTTGGYELAVLPPGDFPALGSEVTLERALYRAPFPRDFSPDRPWIVELAASTAAGLDERSEAPTDAARRLVEALENTADLEEALRERRRKARQSKEDRRAHLQAAARKFSASLHASETSIRTRETFVSTKAEIAGAQRGAMKIGLTRPAWSTPLGKSQPLITPEILRALGFGRDLHEGEYVEVDHEVLCEALLQRRGGPVLERVREWLSSWRWESSVADGLDERSSNGPTGAPAPSAAAPAATSEAEDDLSGDLISSAVMSQIHELSIPRSSPASTLGELAERLTGFVLPAGPADVTSFHDFHQLQIAFEHVWIEAFDDDLREKVTEMYAAVVELDDNYGVKTALPEEISEVHDLKEFVRAVKGTVDGSALEKLPGVVRAQYPAITAAEWAALSTAQQAEVLRLCEELAQMRMQSLFAFLRIDVAGISALLARIEEILSHPDELMPRLRRLLDEIRRRLEEPYAFHYFAPGSVNFGTLMTYRQTWEPLVYQVGDLISTVPLAPGEGRKFSTKQVIKRSRAQRELENALVSRKGESSLTQRADVEITEKAAATTNFKHTAEGSVSFGIANVAAAVEFVLNQAQESARIKKDFREAVIKAAQEYRNERTLDVQTTSDTTTEGTTSGEVSNPNNEVSVTYLLYELERQYRITERIHRVTPVVFVAQDVPAPHQIDEAWLLAHEWILRRVLLDDDLQHGLDLLASFAGEELSVSVTQANWERQSQLVAKLEADLEGQIRARDSLRQRLIETEEARGAAEAAGGSSVGDVFAAIFTGGASLLRSDPTADVAEQLEVARKSIEMQLANLDSTVTDLQARLANAGDALTSATRDLRESLKAQHDRRLAIDQLRIHIKENILFYMQAIWDHEPSDQRFFRLYHIEVEIPEAPTRKCRIRLAEPWEMTSSLPIIERDRLHYVVENCGPPVLPDAADANRRRLVEIADIDRPLGYKGNYIIFPLRACLYLTEFMMQEFVDDYFGVKDPDPGSDVSIDELLEYVENVWNREDVSDAERTRLKAVVLERLRAPRRDSDIVVVPTGEVYIEALLGTHPLLEEFKRVHRAYDVGKVRAELRQHELENLRRAARLLNVTPDLEDPEIDRQIVIHGNAGIHVDTP